MSELMAFNPEPDDLDPLPEPEADAPEPEPDDAPEPEREGDPPALGGPAFEEPDYEPTLHDAAAGDRAFVNYSRDVAEARSAAPDPEPDDEPHGSSEDAKQREELALAGKKESLIAQAEALQVTDQASYDRAADMARTLAGWIKEAEAHFDPDIEAAHRLHKSLCDKRTAFLAPLQLALQAMKDRAGQWYRSEQERAAEERRKAEAAERERVAKEKQAALEAAKKAAATGNVEKAAELVAQSHAMQPAPVSVGRTGPAPAKGMSHKAQWTAECTDLEALVLAIARPRILRELAADLKAKEAPAEVLAYLEQLAEACPAIPFGAVESHDAYLRTRAKADTNTLKWPGVKFYDKGGVAVRA